MHSINIYWVRNYLKTNELFWVDPFWNCGQTIWNKIIKGRQNVSLKFHHSPYLWHSSGDNVFTPVSYPLTLWSCLSHITSLLPLYPGKKLDSNFLKHSWRQLLRFESDPMNFLQRTSWMGNCTLKQVLQTHQPKMAPLWHP